MPPSSFPRRSRVLFVCLGNICRSPAAESILRHQLREKNLQDRCEVASAGTNGFHIGQPPDRRMRDAAEKRGYKLDQTARLLSSRDLTEASLIVAMDRNNLNEINRISSDRRQEIHLLSDFLDEPWPRDVPDPYYGKEEGFEFVLDMLEAASPKIIDHLTSRILSA